ncbi:hypothetical protein DRQ26_00515 [bacterium]|nr:MAG: hypothetical protein DRQ26_00515 [bacterium]
MNDNIQHFTMNVFFKKTLSIIVILYSIFAFADTTDVHLVDVSITPSEIRIAEEHSQVVSLGSIKSIFFFNSQNAQISSDDEDAITSIGNMLLQNPDANLILYGYYSPKFDDILSPINGMKLANRRAESIFKNITKKFPMVGDRIAISNTHDFEEKFFEDSTSYLDMRVKCEVEFANFSPRNFYPTDRIPFWRSSYKSIIKELSPKIKNIFIKNPDAVVVIIGCGFEINGDSYKWLNFLKKKLVEKMGTRFARRIILFANPFEKTKTRYARIITIPRQFMSTGEIYRLWQEPKISGYKIQYTVDTTTTPILPNRFYCDISPEFSYAGIVVPLSSSQGILNIDNVPILSAKYELSFYFPDIGISKKDIPLNVIVEDTFYNTWEIPVWDFAKDELMTDSYSSIWSIASMINALINQKAILTLTISNNCTNEKISAERNELLWKSLKAALSFISDVDFLKIPRWLEKNNVSVEITGSMQSGVGDEEPKNNPLERYKIVLQFSGESR